MSILRYRLRLLDGGERLGVQLLLCRDLRERVRMAKREDGESGRRTEDTVPPGWQRTHCTVLGEIHVQEIDQIMR